MQASPATDQRCFRWSVDGKPVVIDLPLPLVESLAAEVRAGLETTGRGFEMGGLLLGRTRRENGRTLLVIDDIEPVDCEHVAGPSYMLSTADRQLLEARLRRRKGAVVGFYRSNTRKEFAVTVEDVALMGWYFPHPWDTFLLIDTSRSEALRAAFVLWDGRAMAQKTPDDEFPLDAAALAGRSHTESPRALPPAPVRVVKRGWFAAAAVALGLSAGLVVERSDQTEPSRPAAVTRIPSAEPPHVAEPLARAAEPPLAAAEPLVPDAEPALEFAAPPSIGPPPIVPPAIATPRRVHAADRRMLEVPAPKPPVEPPPPEVADAPAIDIPISPVVSLPPLGLPAAAPPPIATKPAGSVSVSAVTRGLGPKFVPPAALREVRPEVPPNLQGRLSRDVQMVRVKVYVDRAGNVQFAELLSNGRGENRELASLAVFAARRWQFAPASRDGKPVEGQAVLRFRFGPSAE